jgi:spermidine synthase
MQAFSETDGWSDRERASALVRDPGLTVAAALMALSGFAGLGYQMIWSAQFGVWLGHEIIAVLAVMAAFFGGLALGALLLGRRIGASARPAHWYAACEALVAVWGLLLIGLLNVANPWLAGLIGEQPSLWWHSTVAFVGPLVLLLPATCAMGATLPAMIGATAGTRERDGVRERARDGAGTVIGRLYAANTAGAVAGVLVAAFVLVPQLGLRKATLVCVVINVICALAAMLALPAGAPNAGSLDQNSSGARNTTPGTMLSRSASALAGRATIERRRLLPLLFATGLLGIGYEVVVVRVLSELAEDTVYTYAILLAVYLLGTAAGAAAYQRWLAPRIATIRLGGPQIRSILLIALCASMLGGALMLAQGAQAQALLGSWFGKGVAPSLLIEALLAMAGFAAPTVVMGALFSHLCVEAQTAGQDLGAALAANTIGAALAPLLFGMLLAPVAGARALLLAIAGAYLLLLPLPAWRQRASWLGALATLATLLLCPPLRFVDVPEGGRILDYRIGAMASVSVIEDADGVARMRINNRQQEGSSASYLTDARQAYLPLLLHPAPRSALFLGLGTGVTANAAAEDPRIAVDAVELLPEVIAASGLFRRTGVGTGKAESPHLIAADARRYVRASAKRYDVIVADLFHPARSGAGALYTTEHFAAIKTRLLPGGVVCQWLPLHQLDLASLRSIVRAFVLVYPDASALLATNSLETPVLGLIAHADGGAFSLPQLRTRLAAADGLERRRALRLDEPFAVLGSFIAGPRALTAFSAPAPANTDDRPVVTHLAPFATYAPEALPRERLLSLLAQLKLSPAELLGADGAGVDDVERRAERRAFDARLAAYWRARDAFLALGSGVRPTPNPQEMLAQVGAPLLDIVRASPDFRPAYDPLLQMALALAASDRPAARLLLRQLHNAQPARPEAGAALAQLEHIDPPH